MSLRTVDEGDLTVTVKNIGGIDETTVALNPGINILSGRNATNRTSFLRAIMAAMGSDEVSIKGDAEEGRVELSMGGESYTRTLSDRNGTTHLGGEPYLDDPAIADLFAFLLRSNDARQAVVQERDLRELIMRPVDTDEIQAEIERLTQQRDHVDEQLQSLDSLKDDLPPLEQRKRSLEAEIESKREELAEKEAEIDAADTDVDESREEKRELESRLSELQELRSELERVRSNIELQEESIETLRTERREYADALEELPETPMGDHEEIERELTRLRERKSTLKAEMSTLQDVIQFNEDLLSGEENAVASVLSTTDSDGEPTRQLVDDDTVTCWTCGSDVTRDRIEATVEQLRSARKELLDDIQAVDDTLSERRATQEERKNQQQRRDQLTRQIEQNEEERERREETLSELRDRREQLNEEIEAVEREVDELESDDFSEILELHREANQLEFEIGQLEAELEELSERIVEIESELSDESELRSRREELEAELESQRTRIDRLERNAVEAFNEHMEEVLELLDYDNLERIWIERVQKNVRDGRRTVEKSVFELHIVRTTDSGVTYEDTIDHLSESEREVTGLVFALAGYLVHDVHESVPFVLLDSVETIDAERLSDLIEYFAEYAEYLVVALLPEDAQVVSSDRTHTADV